MSQAKYSLILVLCLMVALPFVSLAETLPELNYTMTSEDNMVVNYAGDLPDRNPTLPVIKQPQSKNPKAHVSYYFYEKSAGGGGYGYLGGQACVRGQQVPADSGKTEVAFICKKDQVQVFNLAQSLETPSFTIDLSSSTGEIKDIAMSSGSAGVAIRFYKLDPTTLDFVDFDSTSSTPVKINASNSPFTYPRIVKTPSTNEIYMAYFQSSTSSTPLGTQVGQLYFYSKGNRTFTYDLASFASLSDIVFIKHIQFVPNSPDHLIVNVYKKGTTESPNVVAMLCTYTISQSSFELTSCISAVKNQSTFGDGLVASVGLGATSTIKLIQYTHQDSILSTYNYDLTSKTLSAPVAFPRTVTSLKQNAVQYRRMSTVITGESSLSLIVTFDQQAVAAIHDINVDTLTFEHFSSPSSYSIVPLKNNLFVSQVQSFLWYSKVDPSQGKYKLQISGRDFIVNNTYPIILEDLNKNTQQINLKIAFAKKKSITIDLTTSNFQISNYYSESTSFRYPREAFDQTLVDLNFKPSKNSNIRFGTQQTFSNYKIHYHNSGPEGVISQAYIFGDFGIFAYVKDGKTTVAAVECHYNDLIFNLTLPVQCTYHDSSQWVTLQGALNPNVYWSKNTAKPGIIYFDVHQQGTTVYLQPLTKTAPVSSLISQEPQADTLKHIYAVLNGPLPAKGSSALESSTDLYVEFTHYDGKVNVYIAPDFDVSTLAASQQYQFTSEDFGFGSHSELFCPLSVVTCPHDERFHEIVNKCLEGPTTVIKFYMRGFDPTTKQPTIEMHGNVALDSHFGVDDYISKDFVTFCTTGDEFLTFSESTGLLFGKNTAQDSSTHNFNLQEFGIDKATSMHCLKEVQSVIIQGIDNNGSEIFVALRGNNQFSTDGGVFGTFKTPGSNKFVSFKASEAITVLTMGAFIDTNNELTFTIMNYGDVSAQVNVPTNTTLLDCKLESTYTNNRNFSVDVNILDSMDDYVAINFDDVTSVEPKVGTIDLESTVKINQAYDDVKLIFDDGTKQEDLGITLTGRLQAGDKMTVSQVYTDIIRNGGVIVGLNQQPSTTTVTFLDEDLKPLAPSTTVNDQCDFADATVAAEASDNNSRTRAALLGCRLGANQYLRSFILKGNTVTTGKTDSMRIDGISIAGLNKTTFIVSTTYTFRYWAYIWTLSDQGEFKNVMTIPNVRRATFISDETNLDDKIRTSLLAVAPGTNHIRSYAFSSDNLNTPVEASLKLQKFNGYIRRLECSFNLCFMQLSGSGYFYFKALWNNLNQDLRVVLSAPLDPLPFYGRLKRVQITPFTIAVQIGSNDFKNYKMAVYNLLEASRKVYTSFDITSFDTQFLLRTIIPFSKSKEGNKLGPINATNYKLANLMIKDGTAVQQYSVSPILIQMKKKLTDEQLGKINIIFTTKVRNMDNKPALQEIIMTQFINDNPSPKPDSGSTSDSNNKGPIGLLIAVIVIFVLIAISILVGLGILFYLHATGIQKTNDSLIKPLNEQDDYETLNIDTLATEQA